MPSLATAGLGTCVQAAPFQCRISGLPSQPTAQASRAEVAATPQRFAKPPGVGLGTRFHAVPFQCRITDTYPLAVPVAGVRGGRVKPTAQASRAETTATPRRVTQHGD